MRRRIKKELFHFMDIHSFLTSLKVEFKNSYEDRDFYYIETDVEMGEPDHELKIGDNIETLFCVQSKRELEMSEIVSCFKKKNKIDGDFLGELIPNWKSKKFYQKNVFKIKGKIASIDVDTGKSNCFRKSYGFGYLKVV